MPPTSRGGLSAVAAACLAVALAATGSMATAAADSPAAPPTAAAPQKSAPAKLGAADAELLAEARSAGEKNVTLMIATAPGRTAQVVRELSAVKGGSVGRVHDALGYVRATVPTAKADSAIEAAGRLSSVHGIDLRDEVPLPEADTTAAGTATAPYAAPDENTPAANPYNPTHETGAVDFVRANPKADGRGVTIGVLDAGVDLASPALRTTTTGERKIADWVTATDPIADRDGTWRGMTTTVSGPSFTYDGRTWKAPEGTYGINVFRESATAGGQIKGDVNRDGDTTDTWGVLYDAAAGTVRVDLDNDLDFTDEEPMKPYKDRYDVGYFGTDDPATEIAERVPFVVEIRKGVPMDPVGGDWVGKKADFVNIGLLPADHGTHVAGIAAGHGLFGGAMNGAAPGARIVSSRACHFGSGCSTVALTEGMIDLVAGKGVDIVNMSIGGLQALNDGNNARAELYGRLIDTYGVQLVLSGGNSGPGLNTIGDPGLADKVISVGSGVSKETLAANFGSATDRSYQLFASSSRGPREDGGFTPTLVAPGAAVSTIPTWMPGNQTAPQAGWTLPPGYAMFNGTSMAAPQTAGASALLLSAARAKGIDVTPAQLRTALTSSAGHIKGAQAYEEGAGLIDVPAAWKVLAKGAGAHTYTVKAPVDTALGHALRTPGFGAGLYDREGGLKAGQAKTYTVTVTRTSGPDRPVRHQLRLKNNTGRTFSAAPEVDLPLNTPVAVEVRAAPTSAGVKSARLEIDDPLTAGTDHQIMTTVVAAVPVGTFADSVRRNAARSYFVTVPEGARTLEVALGGLADGSRTGFTVLNPYGLPVRDDDPATPLVAAHAAPQPGVWEIAVQSFATSPLADNPYTLDVTAYGATFGPQPATVPGAGAVSWTVRNDFAPVDATLRGGPLGSSLAARPTVAEGETHTTTVQVPEGARSLDVVIGGVPDAATDLDLTVYDAQGRTVGQSADADSDESVTLTAPAAGTYTVEVYAYAVPAGTTAYDYRDVFFSTALGELTTDESAPVRLGAGGSTTVSAEVTPRTAVSEGRELFGEARLVNGNGTVVGTGRVTVGS